MTQPVQRSASSFVLAHLSDPHLTVLDSIRWQQLLNKRMSGYLSWQRRRRHIHTPDRLAWLVHDLQQQAPDHVAITGDLTQLGTPAECATALQWLQALGCPERVSVVPGNHDTYVQAPWSETVGLWRDYMAGADREGFPFLRQRGPLALIGARSAHPVPLAFATGSLGAAQRLRLDELLATSEGSFRVLLIHHPPQAGAVSWRKRLVDAPQVRQVLAERGVELVLHGHGHRRLEDWLEVPGGRAPVIGVPSASAVQRDDMAVAAYNLFRIERQPAGWSATLQRRLIRADGSVSVEPALALSGSAVDAAQQDQRTQ
ncbi:MAG: metallophosphoesterase [Methyloversatilis sp.]|nr:metallophosphoesterase [Methyloversatilis sp.]MBP6194724.1 metallophosphoesterase [Methyloversatilis sp.]